MDTTWCFTRKKKKGWLVEWVEKASFKLLNKLFVISASKRHHQTLLTNRNLLAVIRELQTYIFPHFLPKVLEPSEHYTLKYLHFYEEVRAANAKA